MFRRVSPVPVVLLLVVLAAACGAETAEPDVEVAPAEPTPTRDVEPRGSTPSPTPSPAPSPSPSPTESPTASPTAPPGSPAGTPSPSAPPPATSEPPPATAAPAPDLPVRDLASDCGEPRYAPIAGAPAPPRHAALHAHDPDLQDLLDEAAEAIDGDIGVTVIDRTGGTRAAVNGDRGWYTASLFKLPVLVESLRLAEHGALNLEAQAILYCYYTQFDLDTLAFLGLGPGSAVSLRTAVQQMALVSDTALAVLLYDILGGARVQAVVDATGGRGSTLETEVLNSTPHDLALLLDAIASGYPSAAVADETLALLAQQGFRNKIPAGIPDDGSTVANKTGELSGLNHDVALVSAPFGSYVLAVLSEGVSDAQIAELAGTVHEHLQKSHAEES